MKMTLISSRTRLEVWLDFIHVKNVFSRSGHYIFLLNIRALTPLGVLLYYYYILLVVLHIIIFSRMELLFVACVVLSLKPRQCLVFTGKNTELSGTET